VGLGVGKPVGIGVGGVGNTVGEELPTVLVPHTPRRQLLWNRRTVGGRKYPVVGSRFLVHLSINLDGSFCNSATAIATWSANIVSPDAILMLTSKASSGMTSKGSQVPKLQPPLGHCEPSVQDPGAGVGTPSSGTKPPSVITRAGAGVGSCHAPAALARL